MAKVIGVIGESGAGKTTSLRNLDPKTTFYIDCDKKGDVYKRQVRIDFIISITPGNLNEKALPPPSNTKIPNMTVQLFARKSLT